MCSFSHPLIHSGMHSAIHHHRDGGKTNQSYWIFAEGLNWANNLKFTISLNKETFVKNIVKYIVYKGLVFRNVK